MNETILEASMEMIMNAGDARLFSKEALDSIAMYDFETAKNKLKDAVKKIKEAHCIQTDILQEESKGNSIPYSILFSHAQDTLMSVCSEINMSKQMIKIFEQYEQRIKKLEESKDTL